MMSEAELWHMMLLAADNTFSGMAGIASITFAYLAAAYFVGVKAIPLLDGWARRRVPAAWAFLSLGATLPRGGGGLELH